MKGDRNNTKVIKLKNGDYNSAILFTFCLGNRKIF